MIEEFFLQRQDLIQRGVKLVELGPAEIAAEPIGQRVPLREVGRCSAKKVSRPGWR